jgi:hypothetical protein
MVEELLAPELIESLIEQYLILPYYIPDSDAQLVRQVAAGRFQGLSENDFARARTIMDGVMAEQGEKESRLKKLGYPTSFG